MLGFWSKIKKPFLALAPMEDVTDFIFREVIAEIAPPDVFFTEFTNVAGLISEEGGEVVSRRLKYSERQHPIVAQIWGSNPKNYLKAAKYIKKMKFDGIDINMGCPQRNVVKNRAGAALIKEPILAKRIIQATKEGAGNLPVSVKTRLGFKQIKTEEWSEFLLKQNLAALTMHGRTQKQMSKTPANWEEIHKVVKIRNEVAPHTLIIGNGDIKSHEEALEKVNKYKVDGVMIGRGVFTNPWVFEKQKKEHSLEEHLNLLLKHTKLFEKTWNNKKNFSVMKKFFKIYVREFDGASDLRQKLMETESYEDVYKIISAYKKK